MARLAVWSAANDGAPRRLRAATPDTEANLERWVHQDPSLVRDGLVVVAQQLVFAGRERLDLLCVENRSRWLVVELKRDRMAREVAAQVLDYVSLLQQMPTSELLERLAPHLDRADPAVRQLVEDLLGDESEEAPRDVAAVVVGLSADAALLRLSGYLAEQYEVPFAVVQLQAFRSPSGDLLVLREATDEDGTLPGAGPDRHGGPTPLDARWARVTSAAAHLGAADALARFRAAVDRAGLYARPYTSSVMVTPPARRDRYLALLGFSGHHARFSYDADPFTEFFPELSREHVAATLGPTQATMAPEDVADVGERLVALMRAAHDVPGP